MKKLTFVLLLFSLFVFTVEAQSTYIMAGAGFLPNSFKRPNYCYSCEFPYLYGGATEDWLETEMRPGYSFYIGLGKDIRLNNKWALQGSWKIQHTEYPFDQKGYSLENSPSKELLATSISKEKAQLTDLLFSLSLERNFTLLNREWAVFGGGYVGVKHEDWMKSHYKSTYHYTDIITMPVFDSVSNRYLEKIVSKTKLDPPRTYEGDSQDDISRNPSINYGIHAGLGFPILQSNEGLLNGQLIISRDFNAYFSDEYFDNEEPVFHKTSIMAGLVFKPEKVQRPHTSKPEKRTLSSGVYGGISIHNLYLSINGGWLSTQNLGLDFSARKVFLAKGYTSVYLGPNYQLGNSRFFVKGGLEYFWILNSEGYDEAFFRYFVGGKYVIPFSRRIGLQLEGGYYSKGLNKNLKENQRSFPGFGVGIVFLPAL